MEQVPVLTRSDQLEKQENASNEKFRWMRHFFTEDVSAGNRSLIDLQRRATWIGIACVLQAIDQIDSNWYLQFLPFLRPIIHIYPVFLILGSFFAMWQALRPAKQKKQAERPVRRPQRWQRIALICILLAAIGGVFEFSLATVTSFMSPQYSNDGTSLDTNAAALLLEGRNPYTDSDIVHLVRAFEIQPDWTTPLREGQFAGRLAYPSPSEMRTVLDTDLKAGSAPEFESKVSYPALSFLSLLPFIALGIYNVLIFYVACYLVLVAIAWKLVRPELRPWVLLLALANVGMLSSVAGGNLDIFNIVLIVFAWLLRERKWSSAVFLGLAIATKQPSWLIAPFYAIMIWRHYDFKEAVRRLSIAGVVALAINLPFILWDPHAWLAGVLAPVADPMFPLGDGLISLSFASILPFFPSWVYDILEFSTMIACLVWYWRLSKQRPEAALVFAFMPLFFAWRSLPSYFYCSAFPLFIMLTSNGLARLRGEASQSLSLPFGYGGRTVNDLAGSVGMHAAVQYPGMIRNLR
ncbi:MAG TPA: glycosyltransferase 87 family protein [Ktedonobacteraceae bacterium]|nr:glycosyltransferase 87 family protein [Ktedonobacteraceae bacterium]